MTDREDPDKKTTNRGLWHYRLMLMFLFPVLVVYTVLQSLKYRNLNYCLQRLGIINKPGQTVDIWLHAASVGEVNAALPLLLAMHHKYPTKSFLVTTTTPTGAQLINQKKMENVSHQFLPIDYWLMISRLIDKYQPKCALVMETELWPNLFRYCYKKNIPIITVNGRLSARTMDTRGWIRDLYKTTLQYSTKILTRSDNDSKAYIALGASPEKVITVGNIKFSANITKPKENRLSLNRKYILLASTRPDEELLIASMWLKQKPADCSHLLVIAPRHPQRLTQILNQLQPLKQKIAVRSRNEDVKNNTDIYIVDTVGELPDFIADADIVFMGGSLVPVGGHNILEPAALGRPLLFGPHMDNFTSEAEQLLNFDAAIQVENVDQLGEKLSDMLRNPEKYSELGQNAKQLIEQYKDTADRYVAELTSYIK